MKERNIIDLGLLLPLLTGLIFSSIYFYEYGYVSFYGLPPDLIQVEIQNKSYLFFFCVILFIVNAGLLQPLFSIFVTLLNANKWIVKLILFVVIVLLIYLSTWGLLFSLYHSEIIYLFIALVLGVGFSLLKKTIEITDLKYDDLSLLKYINYSIGHSLGPVLIVGSLTCIFMFNLGNWNAKQRKVYLTKQDDKNILIRKYQSYDLFGIVDSSTPNLKYIIIQKSLTDIDTLYIHKQ